MQSSGFGQEIRPQSAFTAFRALLPSASLFCWVNWSDVAPPLQIVMAVAHIFEFEVLQTNIIVCRGLPQRTKQVRKTAILIYSGQEHPTG